MSKTALRVVKNEANKKEASIYLYGVIGDFWFSDNDPLTARKFLKTLSALEATHDVIHVHINSPGGDVFEGLGICNAIISSKKEIHTWNDGLCASMGASILLSAKKGYRHAAKASMMMLHNASTICWGNAQNMRDTADMLDTTDLTLCNIIGEAAGISAEAAVAKYMDYKDHWLSSAEAETEGFVTIEDYAVVDMPDNVEDLTMDQVAAFYHPKIKNQINNQDPDMGLLSNNKLKKLHALAKVAAEAITQEQVEEVNTELAEAEIEGLTLVKDADLQETIEAAAKIPALEAQVTTLTAEAARVKDLEAEVATLKAELKKPAADPASVDTDGQDDIPPADQAPAYNMTSVDKEKAKQKAMWG